MNDNYLWDRSGEPDPEIQELEELLGELRYQPQPLQIPAGIPVGRQRSFFLPATIAAAIIMAVVLSALWIRFNKKPVSPPLEARQDKVLNPAPEVKQPAPVPEQKPYVAVQTNQQQPRRQFNKNLMVVYKRPVLRRETITPRLTPQELAEKEQVLVALRLVSAKLNLAQRKTLGTPQAPPNIIRNQHKIG